MDGLAPQSYQPNVRVIQTSLGVTVTGRARPAVKWSGSVAEEDLPRLVAIAIARHLGQSTRGVSSSALQRAIKNASFPGYKGAGSNALRDRLKTQAAAEAVALFDPKEANSAGLRVTYSSREETKDGALYKDVRLHSKGVPKRARKAPKSPKKRKTCAIRISCVTRERLKKLAPGMSPGEFVDEAVRRAWMNARYAEPK